MNDYDALRDYLKKQKLPEFVLSFEQIEEIIDAALPRAAHRASWWETLRSPQEKMPQREACLAGGYIATRQAGRQERAVQEDEDRRPRESRRPHSHRALSSRRHRLAVFGWMRPRRRTSFALAWVSARRRRS